ncbi:SMI1/KNR4 family protein [Actinokineospora globicatena]|uniref:SMI1/KNR4 family protein n=1 Tax=Actinokineospora globicatena TaxID=103729 RepID=UPI0025532F62|nr:SMI1/KNR4 family protein [Actinokineospora globicatena]
MVDVAGALGAVLGSRVTGPGPGGAVVARWRSGARTDAWGSLRTAQITLDDLPREVLDLAEVGRYEVLVDGLGGFTLTAALGTPVPGKIVLDPEFRLPGRQMSAAAAPGRPIGVPTDPAVLAEVRALVEEFGRFHTDLVGSAPTWAQPATEAELTAVETRLGVRLPEDLRALYLVLANDFAESGLLGRYSHTKLDWVEPWESWPESVFEQDPVYTVRPAGRVKRLSHSPWWVRFGGDRACNNLFVDLDPDVDGTRGQVIEHGRDFHGAPRLVAASVRDMLVDVVTALRAGRHEVRRGALDVAATFDTGSIEPHSTTFIGVPTEVDDPWRAQRVSLVDAGVADLADLANLSLLTDLNIVRAGRVVGDARRLPRLESLSIDAAAVDTEGTGGHPELWDLSLSGVQQAVRAHDLGGVIRLSIAGIDVPDLESLDVPKVLVADAAQVERLLRADKLRALAALSIESRAPLADVVRLRDQVSGERTEVFHVSGQGLPVVAGR